LLFWAGKLLVDALTRVARFLEWREFVVAFFVMAIAGSLPNLFVGISSALHKIPQLSFGEVVGGNVVDLTIIVALAALIAKGLPAESRMVQTSSIFTICIAILPLFLILDGVLGRGDGIFLILAFALYTFWLFSKEERFKKVYNGNKISTTKESKVFIKNLGKVILGMIFLLVASEGIVKSAQFFAGSFNLPIAIIGILIVGLGNTLPEAYFAIASARKGQTWMILGNLMGAIMVPATLVVGIVALICPIEIVDFSPFAIGRLFLIISAIFFLWVVRTGQKITKKEALFLLGIYIIFVLVEILVK
ncbi:MAG: sodium:calcium antiporter, partial [bacterium]|nr:sodium:calcium antiporter [bacterium]